MLNRSAVVIRPRQPYLEWLRSVEELDLSGMTLDQLDRTLYLVPDYEDPMDAEKVLELVYEEIFCRELEGWYTDEETWPKDRSLEVFQQWFEVEHFELVQDLCLGPIENDE